MAPFWVQVFGTSVGAISQVALICGVGFFAGFFPRSEPILSRSFVKRLATLSMILFEPCLAFYVFSSRLSYSALQIYWVVPLWQLPATAANYSYGRILSSLARCCGLLRHASEKDRTLLQVIPLVCTFQNAVAFLLPILASLCESRSANSLPYSLDTATDAKQACTTDTALFSFMVFILWSLVFWMWGYPKLAALTYEALAAAPVSTDGECALDSPSSMEMQSNAKRSTSLDETPLSSISESNDIHGPTAPCNTPEPEVIGSAGLRLRSNAAASRLHTDTDSQAPSESSDWTAPDFQQSWQEWVDDSRSGFAGGAMVDWSLFPVTPTSSSYFDDAASLATASSGFSLDVESLYGKGSSPKANERVACCLRCRQWVKRRVHGFFVLCKIFLQPALAATFAGIAVGLIGHPRKALFEDVDSPLRSVGRAIYTLGQPGPLMGMLVMSASLAASFRDSKTKDNDNSSSRSNNGTLGTNQQKHQASSPEQMSGNRKAKRASLVIALIPLCVRSLLSPATGLLLVYGCSRLHQRQDLLGRVASVLLPPGLPWLHLCIVLQWASPPAQTIVVACARLGLNDIASGLARMYLALYLMGMVSVTVVCTLALSLLF